MSWLFSKSPNPESADSEISDGSSKELFQYRIQIEDAGTKWKPHYEFGTLSGSDYVKSGIDHSSLHSNNFNYLYQSRVLYDSLNNQYVQFASNGTHVRLIRITSAGAISESSVSIGGVNWNLTVMDDLRFIVTNKGGQSYAVLCPDRTGFMNAPPGYGNDLHSVRVSDGVIVGSAVGLSGAPTPPTPTPVVTWVPSPGDSGPGSSYHSGAELWAPPSHNYGSASAPWVLNTSVFDNFSVIQIGDGVTTAPGDVIATLTVDDYGPFWHIIDPINCTLIRRQGINPGTGGGIIWGIQHILSFENLAPNMFALMTAGFGWNVYGVVTHDITLGGTNPGIRSVAGPPVGLDYGLNQFTHPPIIEKTGPDTFIWVAAHTGTNNARIRTFQVLPNGVINLILGPTDYPMVPAYVNRPNVPGKANVPAGYTVSLDLAGYTEPSLTDNTTALINSSITNDTLFFKKQ